MKFDQYDYNGVDGITNQDLTDLSLDVLDHVKTILEPFDVTVALADAASFSEVDTITGVNEDPNGDSDAYVFLTEVEMDKNGTFDPAHELFTGLCGKAADSDFSTLTGDDNERDEVSIGFVDTLYHEAPGSPGASGQYDKDFSREFAHNIANVAAHEALHTLAVRHTTGGAAALMAGDLMVLNPCFFGDEAMVTRYAIPNVAQNAFDTLADASENVGSRSGVAYVSGTGDADTISVSTSGNQVTVTVNPDNGPQQTFSFNASSFDKLLIYSGPGNDTIDIDWDVSEELVVRGGPGADIIDASGSNNDVSIFGGSSNDTVTGGDGDDRLEGGIGADRYFVEGGSLGSAADTVIDNIITQENATGDNGIGGVNSQANTIQFDAGIGAATIQLGYDFNGHAGTLNYEFDVTADYVGVEFSLKVTAVDELFDLLGTSTNPGFDFDLDGTVTDADKTKFVADILGTWLGDANLDGTVDGADLNALGIHWSQDEIDSWMQGDFDGDEEVDNADLNILGLNWQQTNGNP